MSQWIEMAVRIDITVLQSIEMAVRRDESVSQPIEMAIRISMTVLQSIEKAVRRDILCHRVNRDSSGGINCVTVNRDSLRRDITVSQS